ncbi:hypothetical protein [Solimonas variicoloris]|uniref:hypothetical protein n=1 Tax=Solimonas variicoloris TaxID=254408 RepID=UPI0012B5EEC6|nr:hypothetical protein [Solimonas variicoloris]
MNENEAGICAARGIAPCHARVAAAARTCAGRRVAIKRGNRRSRRLAPEVSLNVTVQET